MRTFGTATLERQRDGTSVWRVTAEPHVMIRLKSVLRKCNTRLVGTVFFRYTPETCRDLEWFIDRYPLDVIAKDNEILKKGADQYRARCEAMERIRAPDYAPRVFNLALPARHYQAVAAESYLTRGSQLLADHVGLGKSVTALAAATDKRTLPMLVVCQTHLPRQWRDYAGKFLPLATSHIIKVGKLYNLPPADIYICTYHRLDKWAEVLKNTCRSVVFDEVQELRHQGSQKYCAAAGVREKCEFAQGLSATPIFNYGGEIFSVLDILSPGEVGTEAEFQREWCDYSCGHARLKDPEAFGAHLRETGLMVRRTRAEVGMELPPTQTIVETVEYNEKVLLDLDTCATELAHRILAADSDFHSKGEAAREFDLRLRQATGISKAPYCAAFVRMLLEEGDKVVLTGWHRECYSIWTTLLSQWPRFMYTGSESPKQKDDAVRGFVSTKGPAVFLMSLRSGSGLDGLQEVCSTIVHGELDWSPQVHTQCTGRLARDGQQQSVFEYYMVSDGGSDPTIADILGLKKAQSDLLLGNPKDGSALVQADDVGRVKRLAQDYLARRNRSRTEIACNPNAIKI